MMDKATDENKQTNVNTPYDDVFRTLLTDCSSLIIPVINELFHEDYDGTEEIINLQNERILNWMDGEQGKRVTDSYMSIIKNNISKFYHFECQSTEDGSIIVRFFEYDSQIALSNSVLEEGKLTVKFPESALLALRSSDRMKDKLTICIQAAEKEISYEIPVLKIKEYSLEEIFKKDLYFLIPFHIFVYEKDFGKMDKNEEQLEELKKKYLFIVSELGKACKAGKVNEYIKNTIINLSHKVVVNIAKKYDKVAEGVGDIMGGKILDYEAKDILRQGIEQGMERGLKQGEDRMSRLMSYLLMQGKIDEAKRASTDEEVRKELYKKYNIGEDDN